jgi:hypothetical protein
MGGILSGLMVNAPRYAWTTSPGMRTFQEPLDDRRYSPLLRNSRQRRGGPCKGQKIGGGITPAASLFYAIR